MNKVAYILLFCLSSFLSFAQDDNQLYDHDIDENRWEKLRDGIRYEGKKSQGGIGQRWTYPTNQEYKQAVEDYSSGSEGNSATSNGDGLGSGGGSNDNGTSSYEPGDDPSDVQEYNPPPPPPQDPPSRVTVTGLGAFGYVLLAAFIGGLIFLVFYLWVKSPKDGKKITEEIVLEDVNPIEIPLTELQRLLQEAISKGDYRGAVRIYFIFIVRDLTQKGKIHWEKEKTNFHYSE